MIRSCLTMLLPDLDWDMGLGGFYLPANRPKSRSKSESYLFTQEKITILCKT